MTVKPQRNRKIIVRQEADEAFLFNPDNGAIKIINSTGIFIWGLCDGKHSRDAIIKKMLDKFELATQALASKDLEKFLVQLRSAGFILEG